MSRVPLQFVDFTKGCVLKADLLGGPFIPRISGFQIGDKLGTLRTFGGWEDWDTTINFQELQGLHRWYDEEGGATFFVFGNDGSNYGLWRYDLESKSCSFIQQDTDFDRQAPVLFVNCDNQVIHLPDGKKDSPYSTKLRNSTTRLTTQKLGLIRPLNDFTVSAVNDITVTTRIDGGKEYKWYVSYSYGTKSEPNRYGESALSDPVILTLPTATGTYTATISNLTPISLLIQRINIYRTLGDGVTPYRVGYIDEAGVTQFFDNFNDSDVDLSFTSPTLTGLPGVIRCARWHNDRLYYFGNDGRFRWSAAGLPDVHPSNFFLDVGQVAYWGTWVGVLRDNIFVGKQDGIYLIIGDSPNYRWRKVSDVQCFSRCSMVEMADGIYFLGKERNTSRVYRFDGNSAVAISDSITPIFRNSTLDAHKKAYGKRVGVQYWLEIMTTDTRFTAHTLTYNNLLLIYDTRSGGWFTAPTQAAAIEVFNGPQDNGEIYICESDPNTSTSKGTIFKYNAHVSTINKTVYTSVGVRSYNKFSTYNRRISLFIPGVNRETEDNSFEKIIPQALRLRIRGFLGSTPSFNSFTDSETLQVTKSSNLAPEASEEYATIDIVGDDASIYGTGKWGSAILQDRLLEERLFDISETEHFSGYIADVVLSYGDTRAVDIEGIEFLYDTTNKE